MTKQTLVGILVAVVVVVLSNSLYVIRETQRGGSEAGPALKNSVRE